MNYTRIQAFREANENLIFHTQKSGEHWCFPRAHLIYSAAAHGQIDFLFPLYCVSVMVEHPVELLAQVLQGETSVLTEVSGANAAEVLVTSIVVTGTNPEAKFAKHSQP